MTIVSKMFGSFKSHQPQKQLLIQTLIGVYQNISNTNTSDTKDTLSSQAKSFFSSKSLSLHLIYITLGVVFFTLFFHRLALADTLTSPTFQIDMSTINISGGRATSGSYNLTQTTGQTFQGQFDSAGYTIKAGFQYIYVGTPFTFNISDLDINFGTLVPNTPSLGNNILTVTTGSAYGYSVKVVEDHPLRLSNGVVTIADTSCDLALTCTPTDATPWTDNGRYGFGYNIQGTDVDTGEFVDATYFRPFPIQNVDDPIIIMSRSGIATNSAATVTYKVNISGSQGAGVYQNNIQYIAIPSY